MLLEFPGYIKRLENLENNFDANVGWKEFKFCFKLGTGQIVRPFCVDNSSYLNLSINHLPLSSRMV